MELFPERQLLIIQFVIVQVANGKSKLLGNFSGIILEFYKFSNAKLTKNCKILRFNVVITKLCQKHH